MIETVFYSAELDDENDFASESLAVAEETVEWDFEESPTSATTDCGCGGAAVTESESGLSSDLVAGEEAPSQQVKVSLFKMKNWPEFKVTVEKKCKWVLGKRICVNVPRAFQRTCVLEAFAIVSHPQAESIRGDIIGCVRTAVATGAVAGVLTGNVAAAVVSLKGALVTCLTAKGRSQLNKLAVKITTETACGEWKPR